MVPFLLLSYWARDRDVRKRVYNGSRGRRCTVPGFVQCFDEDAICLTPIRLEDLLLRGGMSLPLSNKVFVTRLDKVLIPLFVDHLILSRLVVPSSALWS